MHPVVERVVEAAHHVPPRARLGVAVVLVLTLVGYACEALFTQWQQKAAAADEARNRAAVTNLVNAASKVLAPTLGGLEKIAEDPQVIAALSGVDASVRDTLAATLQKNFPNALRLRLVPRGMTQTDPNSSPPLTYASLDLLLKAEKSATPPGAEIHLAGLPQEHLAIVRRAPPAGDPVGFLHLSMNTAPVRDALAKLLAQNPKLNAEIRQPISGAPPVVLANVGKPGVGEEIVSGVPGTTWVVALRTSQRGTLEIPDWWQWLLAIPALGLLAAWWRMRRGRTVPQAPSTTVLTGAISAILSGQHPGLAQLLPGAQGTKDGHPPARPLSQGLDGEDVTRVPVPAPAPASAPPPVAPAASKAEGSGEINAGIFRSYDIRGVVGESLTAEAMYQIGRAFGTEAGARQQQTVIVARDGRASSTMLRGALVEGLRDSGRDVLDIGLTPTPVLYFATHYLDTRTGVMITGSHNPPQYNGAKLVLDGETLSGDAIQAIRTRIAAQDFSSGTGSLQEIEIIPDYIRRISEEIPVNLGEALKVVVDCGNSVPGIVAPHILRAIGHDVIELYCEVDGEFPNHHPDPSQPENLEDLIAIVRHEQADIGLAFDGDGDRLGVVDRNGDILWPDRQLMLFAQDVLKNHPGAKVIYDVKCSQQLPAVIRAAGGEPILSRTGHSIIKQEMAKSGALLAGELSGHIFFKDRWYGFDDALYSAARLLEILVNANEPPEAVFARLPQTHATPELRVPLPESRHTEVMQALRAAMDFPTAEVVDLDGLRVEFEDSWGLVRPSNTTPCLVVRFEGTTEEALHEVKERFRVWLLGVEPTLQLPF